MLHPDVDWRDMFRVEDSPNSSTPMEAVDIASFIHRSFKLSLPYQFYREFLVNALEAGATLVLIEPDWLYIEACVAQGEDPVYRWSIWDNGCGMSKEDLIEHFGKIFSSSKCTWNGIHGNFGMGAKIAACPISPAGVLVMSWQNGEGHMMHLHLDKHTGQYVKKKMSYIDEMGRRVFGEVIPTLPMYDRYYDTDGELKRRVNGTLIILLGQDENHHTFAGFHNLPEKVTWKVEGAKGKAREDWHIRIASEILNTRFSDLQDGVEVRAYGVAKEDISKWAKSRAEASAYYSETERHGQYRILQGAFPYWNEIASANGSVQVSGGTMHWWLFNPAPPEVFEAKDDYRVERGLQKFRLSKKAYDPETGLYDPRVKIKDRHSYAPRIGVTAVAYKGELYDYSSAHHVLTYCGIHKAAVRERLVLVMEPDYTEDSGVYPNAVRSGLEYTGRKDGRLPWDRWGASFNNNMPAEIVEALKANETSADRDYVNLAHTIMKNAYNDLREFGIESGDGQGPRKLKWECINDQCSTDTFMAFKPEQGNACCPDCSTLGVRWKNPNPQARQLNWVCNTCAHEFKAPRPGNGDAPPCPECGSANVSHNTAQAPHNPGKGRIPKITLEIYPVGDNPGVAEPAQFNLKGGTLTVYGDFHMFVETIDRWVNRYAHYHGIEDVVPMVVTQVYGDMLFRRVLHLLSCQGGEFAQNYDDTRIKHMTSSEAMTTSVAGFYDSEALIKQRLSGRLGRMKVKTD